MPVHHGRHEMPGWRGYLPESVDRATRARSGRRDRGLLGTPSRRVAAVGALAVCAVAGGAVITTRSAGPPDAFLGAGRRGHLPVGQELGMDARGHGRPHGDRDRARADRRGPAAVGHLLRRPPRRATATRGPRPARASEGAGRASRRAQIRDGRDPLRVGVGGRDGHRLAAATGRTGDAASPRRRSQRPRRPGRGNGPATRPRRGRVGRVCRWPEPGPRQRCDPEGVRGHRDRRVGGDDLDAARSVDRGDHLGGRGPLGLGCGARADGAGRVSDRSGVGCRRPAGPVGQECGRRRHRDGRSGLSGSRCVVGPGRGRGRRQRRTRPGHPAAGHPDAAGLVLARSDTSRTVRADDADLRAFVARAAGRGIDGGREGTDPEAGRGDGHDTGIRPHADAIPAGEETTASPG